MSYDLNDRTAFGISGEYDSKRSSGEVAVLKKEHAATAGEHSAVGQRKMPSTVTTAIPFINPRPSISQSIQSVKPDLKLLCDELLANAPRTLVNGHLTPTLGGIVLVSRIGHGGMGAVYRGIHPRLGQDVAVKVLRFDLVKRDPTAVQRFIREARLAFSVQSPNLVRVIDVNDENGLFYLVMEYVDGKTAGTFQRDEAFRTGKPLSEKLALDICIGAAMGLEAAHRKNVIHRDIKPENILIPYAQTDGSGENRTDNLNFKLVKLVDLGLARKEMRDKKCTRTNFALGTPGFMAPEQALDASAVSKSADCFGLAATLYTLLTGMVPMRQDVQKVALIRAARPACHSILGVRADVSNRTAKLLDQCFALQPECRPADATAMLIELKLARTQLDRKSVFALK